MTPEKPWYLAHSYADELPPKREPIEPIITSWWEAVKIIGMMILVGALFVGIGLLLFLWAGAVVEAP